VLTSAYAAKYDIWRIMRQEQKPALTGAQIRAARALLGWSASDLSQRSAVSLRTIQRAELAETSMTTANQLAVRRALEAAGVQFIDENGGGPGVRLRKRQRPKAPKQ
jgi:transcriptional regulator with XRE-family HTH domain